MTAHSDLNDLLVGLLGRAKRLGAEAADAIAVDGASVSTALRLGQLERLERSEGRDIGLRVLIGRRQACVSSSDVATTALDELAERAVAMARVAPEDPTCGLAPAERLARAEAVPDLDTAGGDEVAGETLRAWAQAAEDAARAVSGVTNSEGAEAGWSRTRVALAASNGFVGAYTVGRVSCGVSVLAGTGTKMERDYDHHSAVHAADLRDPAQVGRSAGERAVRRLGAGRIGSGRHPVIFDPRVSGGLVGHLASAVNGQAVARGTSFLRDSMGKAVMARGLTIRDDPHRLRGLRSKPFDAEGLDNPALDLVADGVLGSWVLDLATARQLGLESNGRAARGTGAPPSPSTTNLYMAPGTTSREELIAGVAHGVYVTELIGFGVNPVTGDYSRGAAGFRIENGHLTDPVNEFTIAGNLKDMFLNLTPADDLEFRYGTDAPTVRVDGLTIAGR